MKTIYYRLTIVLMVLIPGAGCKNSDSNCTLAARQPRGNWQFITAYPSNVISAPSGSNVGAANIKCYYQRPCTYWFNCCGKFFPITGIEYGSSDPGPGNTMPVITLGMPLPLQGALGQVASSLGVSIEIATWFQNQAAADAACGAAIGINHAADYYEKTPTCNNSEIKLPWHTWPKSVALESLPTDERLELIE